MLNVFLKERKLLLPHLFSFLGDHKSSLEGKFPLVLPLGDTVPSIDIPLHLRTPTLLLVGLPWAARAVALAESKKLIDSLQTDSRTGS